MRLGLKIGIGSRQSGGGSAPSVPPSFVDSTKASGTGASISGGSLVASGPDRYIFAMVGTGTSDNPTAIDLQIVGSSGSANMSQVFFSGTNTSDPSTAFEAFAGFVIGENDLPGDGPYSFSGSITSAITPNIWGLVAGSAQNASNSPTVSFERLDTITATPSGNNALAIVGLGTSTQSSLAGMTGATQEENLLYGDGLQLGQAVASTSGVTVSNTVTGRPLSAIAIFEA